MAFRCFMNQKGLASKPSLAADLRLAAQQGKNKHCGLVLIVTPITQTLQKGSELNAPRKARHFDRAETAFI